MSDIIKLSKEGYAKLEARLEYLLTEGRQQIRKEIEIAKGFGDLSENAEYSAARAAQSRMEGAQRLVHERDRRNRRNLRQDGEKPHRAGASHGL